MPPDHRIPIPHTTLIRLLNDIGNLATNIHLIRSRVYRLGTRPSIHREARRRSLERRYGMRLGCGLGNDFGFGIVRSGDLKDSRDGEEGRRYPDIEFGFGFGFGEEGEEGDSLPPSPDPSTSSSSSPGAGARSKRKRPEVHFRGGGYSREYTGTGRHGTPNVTRAPPESRNQRVEAGRGGRRTRRVRPGRSEDVDEEVDTGDESDGGDDGMEMEVEEEEGRGRSGGSEEVGEDKEHEGGDDGKGGEDRKGKEKGKERAV